MAKTNKAMTYSFRAESLKKYLRQLSFFERCDAMPDYEYALLYGRQYLTGYQPGVRAVIRYHDGIVSNDVNPTDKVYFPLKKVRKIVAGLDDSELVTFDTDRGGEYIGVTTDKIGIVLQTIPPDRIPGSVFDNYGGISSLFNILRPQWGVDVNGIDGAYFRRIVSKLTETMSTDDLRPNFCGAFMGIENGGFTFCSTDGRMLTELTYGHQKASNCSLQGSIVRANAVKYLNGLYRQIKKEIEPVRIYREVFGDDRFKVIFAISEDMKVVADTVDDRFPEFRRAFPTPNLKNAEIIVNRLSLLKATQRMSVLGSIAYDCTLEIQEGSIRVSHDSENGDSYEEDISLESVTTLPGYAKRIGFNCLLLQRILSKLGTEPILSQNVTFNFHGNNRAMMIAGNDGRGKLQEMLMLMPVMLPEN